MVFFFRIFFFDSGYITQLTMCIIMMRKNASSEVANFMAPRSGVLVLGQGSNDCIVKMH